MDKEFNCDDSGKLVLRLMVGGMMLFHGISKMVNGIDFISGMLDSRGLPSFIAWGVYIGEVIAPLFIVVGVLTRFSASVLVFNMVVAVLLVHTGDVFAINSHGGWAIELQAFYIFSAVAIAMLGPGKYRILKRVQGLLE